MDLDKIRKMDDTELENYLKNLTKRNSTNCVKCGKASSNYTMNIQNKKQIQQKKLCCLCEDCYTDLLDYLGTTDILWDQEDKMEILKYDERIIKKK